MKLDFSTKLKDIKGKPIKDGDTEITLGAAAAHALLQRYEDERNLSGDESARRFKLAVLVVDGGKQEVTVEQAADLKKFVAKAYAPLIVGRVYEIIDKAPS